MRGNKDRLCLTTYLQQRQLPQEEYTTCSVPARPSPWSPWSDPTGTSSSEQGCGPGHILQHSHQGQAAPGITAEPGHRVTRRLGWPTGQISGLLLTLCQEWVPLTKHGKR